MNPRSDSFGHFLASMFVEIAKEVHEEMEAKDQAKAVAPVSAETESIVNDIMIERITEAIDKALAERDEQTFMWLTKQKESLVAPTTNDSVEK